MPSELMPAAHIIEGVAHSLSTDKRLAQMVFKVINKDEPGGVSKFAITIEVTKLKWLQQVVGEVIKLATRSAALLGAIVHIRPEKWGLGTMPAHPGHIFITFDEGLPTESTYLLPLLDALTMSTEIEKLVRAGMTMKQRRDLMLTPTKKTPKIIVPN